MDNFIDQVLEKRPDYPENKSKKTYVQPRIIFECDLETRAGSPLPGINPDIFPFDFP